MARRKRTAPLILDTNIFDRRDFLDWLKSYRGQKIIPAVAYAELYVYYVGVKGKEQSTLDHLLRKLDIQFARMEKIHCAHGGIIGINCGEFETHWRDYLIAAHAFNAPYIVVTENSRDFPFLEGRVMTIDDAMRDLHCVVR